MNLIFDFIMINNIMTFTMYLLVVFIAETGSSFTCNTDISPAFLYCPEPITYAHDGNATVLPCAVTQWVRKCLWFFGNENITEKTVPFAKFDIDINGTCNLNLTVDDASIGNYTCIPQVTPKFLTRPSVRTDVMLYQMPSAPRLLNKTKGEIAIDEKKSAELVCESEDGVPPPLFSWYIGVDNFTFYSKQVNSSSTFVTGFLKEWFAYNGNTITCQIQHATLNTTLNDTAVFKVAYKPKILNHRPLYTITNYNGDHFTIVFEIASDSPLNTNRTGLSILDNEGTLKTYKLGDTSEDGLFSLSEAMAIKGSKRDDYMYFTFNISSVTDDVLQSEFGVKVYNVDGKESVYYDFKIYMRKSTTKWMTLGIGITVVVLFIAAVAFAVISRKGLPWRKSPSCISLINKTSCTNEVQMQQLNESRRNSLELNDGVFITSDYQGSQNLENTPETTRRNEDRAEKSSWIDTLVQLFIG